MKFLSHLRFSKSQRSGIFFLILIIISSYLFSFAIDFFSKGFYQISKEKTTLLAENIKKKRKNIYTFNPNYLSDYSAYTLGLTILQIDKLQAYRNADKYVNSIEEFQKVTGVSDSLLNEIAPYFIFPAYKSYAKSEKKVTVKRVLIKKDINKATVDNLKKVYGIGDKLATRIVKYRELLGGFYFKDQLNEVYGLKPNIVKNLFEQFTIIEEPKFSPININSASVKELSNLPYIDWIIAKKIVTYRTSQLKIDSISELRKIEDFPTDKLNRIELYLTTD